MRTCSTINDLRPRYVWTRPALHFLSELTSQRLTPLRFDSLRDLAPLMRRDQTGGFLTLKYFVKNCYNRLKSGFLSLQYPTYMSHNAVSRTRATRQPHSSHSHTKAPKLQSTLVHQLLERIVQVISGVLAFDRSNPFDFASTDARTTSHWTAR